MISGSGVETDEIENMNEVEVTSKPSVGARAGDWHVNRRSKLDS
jgi:hypothetical protein